MALMVSLGPDLNCGNKTSKQNKIYEVIISDIGQQLMQDCDPWEERDKWGMTYNHSALLFMPFSRTHYKEGNQAEQGSFTEWRN